MTNRNERVDILLSTNDGAPFLHRQLQSLTAQTVRDWRLIARGDGSTDSTRAILENFARKHPGGVPIFTDCEGRLGPAAGFSRLMALAEAEHVMFFDQDDVWLPNKIEKTLSRMRRLGARKDQEMPAGSWRPHRGQ